MRDDYLLGNRIAALGQKVELAPRTVTIVLHEPSLRALFLHELRWARTIRTVRPLGYAGTVVTFSVVWALGALLAFRFSPAGWLALAVALALRAGIRRAVRRTFGLGRRPAAGWMPLREILSFFVYCASHGGPQSAAPNPTGAQPPHVALGIRTVRIPGCPYNGVNRDHPGGRNLT